jgi:hypothetical protein
LSHHSEPYVRKNPFGNVLPRLLTIKQTASYGASVPTASASWFSMASRLGRFTPSALTGCCSDREQQDRAIDVCGKRAEVA